MDTTRLNSKNLFEFLFNTRSQKRRTHYNNLWLAFVALWESDGHHGRALHALMVYLSSVYPNETRQLVQDVLMVDLAALLKSQLMLAERSRVALLVSLYTLLAKDILGSALTSIAFLYDLWSLHPLSLSLKVCYTAAMGEAWPELLSETEPRVPPLLGAIQALIGQAMGRRQAVLSAEALSSLHTLGAVCHWRLDDPALAVAMDAGAMCGHFVDMLMDECAEPTEFAFSTGRRAQRLPHGDCRLSPLTFQTLSGIAIICQGQGWPWTYQHFISTLVWPRFGELGEAAALGSSPKVERQMGLLVLLLAQLSGLPLLETPSPSIQSSIAFLKSRFESILQGCLTGQYIFSIHVQSLYAMAIVKYSTLGAGESKSAVLARWLEQHQQQQEEDIF